MPKGGFYMPIQVRKSSWVEVDKLILKDLNDLDEEKTNLLGSYNDIIKHYTTREDER